VKGKGKTEALRAEREAQDGDENEDWFFSDDVGSSNSGYYVLQVIAISSLLLILCLFCHRLC
jgi:hypothetical protein